MKLINNRSLIIATAAFLLLGIASCKKDFLETTPASPSDATIWSSYTNANLFVNDIYADIPTGFLLFDVDPFDNWTDNQFPTFNWVTSLASVAPRNYNSTSSPVNSWWTNGYAEIRKCNIVLQNAPNIPDASDEDKNEMIAQAKFFRAYWYSWLINFFGGVPIISVPLNKSSGDTLNYPRSTYDECVTFIQQDLADAASALPDEWSSDQHGRVTKGAALALKSEVELYASKWQDCVNSCSAIFALGKYSLADYNTMLIPAGEVNDEVIFDVDFDGKTKAHNAEIFLSPRVDPASGIAAGWGHVQPTQELVDDYEFTDGKPGTDASHANDPYTGRDKRFYASILYNGSDWRGGKVWTYYDPTINVYANNFDINFSHQGTQTGYYFHKYLDPTLTPSETNYYGKAINGTNAVLFRLGEIYLNFAEAQNELSGPTGDVYKYINLLRERGGVPGLPPGLSKDQMREHIRHERRIELAFEGKRYFDIMRWKIAGQVLNKTLTGMEITGTPGNWIYTRVPAYNGKRVFNTPRDYLFPIPSAALDQNPKLTQNPGW
ncbi:MAG TPA: RagB/SusD family nutrient uptake outer membrane protein [Parafilimonas sp.]|nr:RagB/SusD family nutrient uptake outer membrane protein [Parafilimonas sp.]